MWKSNPLALKEWAIVVWAMAQGSQILLLRKGGIAEEEGEFRLASQEFFLYPTAEHQHESLLQPQYVEVLRNSVLKTSAERELLIQHYVVVTDILPAPELSRMKQLRDAFVWNDLFLEKRYSYKPQSPLAVLLVRTYSLPQPVQVPYRERYAGCRSWVELEESLSTEGALPVLSDQEFERRREALRRRITQTIPFNPETGTKKPVTAIVLFAHGSTVLEANQGVARLAEEVSRRAQCPAGYAFLELAQPDLTTAVGSLAAAGVQRIVVVPYFLSMGVHVRQDLPQLIEQQRALFPNVQILVGQSLEGYPGMTDVVLDRVRETLSAGKK